MRVALLHNASAGSEDHDDAELSEVIRGAWHEVIHLVRRVGELTAALHEEPCDLVVVAGGDGTVDALPASFRAGRCRSRSCRSEPPTTRRALTFWSRS